MVRWHLDFRTGLVRDDQIKRAGDAAIRNYDRTELGTLHDAVIVNHAEAAGSNSFSSLIVTCDTVCEKDRLHVAGKTNLTFTAK